MPSAVVLVLAWNGQPWLRPCLAALRAQTYPDRYAVLVVDNGSTDGSADLVAAEFPEVALIRSARNLGFGPGNNLGLRALRDGTAPAPADFRPDLVALLNQDTVVEPGWLAAIAETFARHPDAAVVGCKIFGPDGLLQHAGGRLRWPLATGGHAGAGEADTGQYEHEGAVEWVTGAAMALRGDLPPDLGSFDEGFTPAYYEDVDLCFRARAAGHSVIYTPAARLTHHENSSLGAQSAAHQRAYHRNRLRFLLRHGPLDDAGLAAFVAAEEEEIARWSLADSIARKGAYLDATADLPGLLAQRDDIADPGAARKRVTVALTDLHRAAVREEHTRRAEALIPSVDARADTAPAAAPDEPRPPEPEASAPPTDSYETLRRQNGAPDEPRPPEPEASAPPTDDHEPIWQQDGAPAPQEPMSSAQPEQDEHVVDVAAIMRQIRRQISERREREDDRALDKVMSDVNEGWNKVYAPLSLPPSGSLPGRAWDLLRVRLHHEVRGYLDNMIFRQTEFNGAVVRALNTLARRTAPSTSAEVEALRDELIQLREEVRRLREELERR